MRKQGVAICLAWMRGTIELSVYLAPFLFVAYWLVPHGGLSVWVLHLTLYYPIGYLISLMFKQIRNWLLIVMIGVLSLLIAYFANNLDYAMILSVLLGGFWMMRGARSFGKYWYQTFQHIQFYAGLVLALVFAWIMRLHHYPPIFLDWLQASGILTILAAVFVSNRNMLNSEAHHYQHKGVSTSIARQNLMLAFVLLVVIFIISLYKQLDRLLSSLAGAVRDWIRRLVEWLNGHGQTSPPDQIQPSMPRKIPDVSQHPSLFWRILEDILLVGGYLILAGLILGIVFLLIRALFRLFPQLKQYFMQMHEANEEEGYIDEKSNLLDLRDWVNGQAEKWRERLERMRGRNRKWNEFTDNAERVRWLFRIMIKDQIFKGYTFHKDFTPEETARDLDEWKKTDVYEVHQIVALYNRIRYGEKKVHDEEVRNVWYKP